MDTARRALAIAALTALAALCGCSGDDAASKAGKDAGTVGDAATGGRGRDAGTDAGASTDAGPDMTLRVVKSFFCKPNAMPGTTSVLDVTGDGDADIALRATDAACQYELLYRKSGKDSVLSARPGGYLILNAGAASDGAVVVCASNIQHGPDALGAHAMSAVTLECTVKPRGGSFVPMATLVDGASDYAAWVDEIAEVSDEPGTYEVRWFRDFSFQFMNLGEAGRPSTDGTYRTRFRLAEAGGLSVIDTQRVPADRLPADTTQSGWEPTAAELSDYSEWVDPRDGDCPPPGCPE